MMSVMVEVRPEDLYQSLVTVKVRPEDLHQSLVSVKVRSEDLHQSLVTPLNRSCYRLLAVAAAGASRTVTNAEEISYIFMGEVTPGRM